MIRNYKHSSKKQRQEQLKKIELKSETMDIYQSHEHKKTLRAATWLLRKKLGKTAEADAIHSDLTHCGNAAVQLIVELLNNASDEITELYQKNTVKQLGELLIWIIYKDTAYRDPLFWMLYQLGNDTVKDLVRPYVKEPEDWYVNLWHKSKEHTKELRERGEIAANAMSPDEEIFTPVLQRKKLNKYK
jgi:hypothetical protein